MLWLFITYDAGDGPDRLIVKLPATDSAIRAAGQLGYRCETTFYHEYVASIHIQNLVTATMRERRGVGVVEQIAIGPHQPSGLTGPLDGHRAAQP